MAKIKIPTFKFTRKHQVIGLLILLALVGLVWFSLSKTGNNRLITSVEIKIPGDEKSSFTNQQEISNIISGVVGNPISHSANEINLTLLEIFRSFYKV